MRTTGRREVRGERGRGRLRGSWSYSMGGGGLERSHGGSHRGSKDTRGVSVQAMPICEIAVAGSGHSKGIEQSSAQ